MSRQIPDHWKFGGGVGSQNATTMIRFLRSCEMDSTNFWSINPLMRDRNLWKKLQARALRKGWITLKRIETHRTYIRRTVIKLTPAGWRRLKRAKKDYV